MAFTFTVDDTEQATFTAWQAEHDKTCRYADPKRCGSIGGRFTFEFTGTSLGSIVKARCACNAVKDLTDYDSF